MVILSVLRDGPLHGYGIAREIERRSGGALSFKEGTLYPALHALERDGLLVATWQEQANGPSRKVYALTEAGVGELARRTRTWRQFARSIAQVMGGTNEQRA